MEHNMSLDLCVIAELRRLFKAGATPSRLVRHIVAEHGGEPQVDRLVRTYFREAFGIPMFRASASLLTLPAEELPFAGVNAATIHQMVERRAEWDRDATPGVTWMDSLVATDAAFLNDQTRPEQFGELAAIWGQLGEPAQTFIKRLVGNAQHLHEKVNVLSRLVEQLQQQVVALECGEELQPHT